MGTKFVNLTQQEMVRLLANENVGHLGVCVDKKMYVVPISYAFEDHQLYFHTHEGLKVQMMRKNPAICFQVDNRSNMANWQSVIIWGEFHELQGEARENALRMLLNRKLPILSSATTHLGHDWPFSAGELDDIEGVVFSIHIKEMTGKAEETQEIPLDSI